jgi:phasin
MSMRDMTTTSKNSMATKMSGRQFEMPKNELPANLRELANEVMAQTRGNYEQIETAAIETMQVLVSTQSAAAKSIENYRAWLMKVAHGNVIAAFDFAQNLATAKSVPDVIEYSRAHVRIQFDALAAQTKELTDHAHNIATQMAEPIKTSITGAGENAT